MAEDVHISTMGMNCPKPLIETRKALKKLESGQILVVEGDHMISEKEIPKAVTDTGEEVVSVESNGSQWKITIRKA